MPSLAEAPTALSLTVPRLKTPVLYQNGQDVTFTSHCQRQGTRKKRKAKEHVAQGGSRDTRSLDRRGAFVGDETRPQFCQQKRAAVCSWADAHTTASWSLESPRDTTESQKDTATCSRVLLNTPKHHGLLRNKAIKSLKRVEEQGGGRGENASQSAWRRRGRHPVTSHFPVRPGFTLGKASCSRNRHHSPPWESSSRRWPPHPGHELAEATACSLEPNLHFYYGFGFKPDQPPTKAGRGQRCSPQH